AGDLRADLHCGHSLNGARGRYIDLDRTALDSGCNIVAGAGFISPKKSRKPDSRCQEHNNADGGAAFLDNCDESLESLCHPFLVLQWQATMPLLVILSHT